ncbi:MAG: SPOR domain-containing protein [Chromatocurvus sp.]
MDASLKQRLVGAMILLALGVVFWPIIFVPPEGEPVPRQEPIPPAPQVDNGVLPAPGDDGLRPTAQPGILTQEAGADVIVPDSASRAESGLARGSTDEPERRPVTRDTPPQMPSLDEDGIPIAWSLQVATMGSRDAARALRDELIGAEMKAYIQALRRGNDTLYRVFVGPKFERKQLEPIKRRVDSRYDVESLIARYAP